MKYKRLDSILLGALDDFLKVLEKKEYPTQDITKAEHEDFLEKAEKVNEAISIMYAPDDQFIVNKPLLTKINEQFYFLKMNPKFFNPYDFVSCIYGNIISIKGETCVYKALISLCKIMSYYESFNAELFIDFFEKQLNNIEKDHQAIVSHLVVQIASIFWYSYEDEGEKTEALRKILSIIRNKQDNTRDISKDIPSSHSLSGDISDLINCVLPYDEESAKDFLELYNMLTKDTAKCPVSAIYDSILNNWDSVKSYMYTYRIIHNLIIYKTNWNFTANEIKTITKILKPYKNS
ncbi:MAG: hypothetical protein SPH96_13150 [Agathobacter sp.]|nr:hypothetical protein [Agathobacter sp.]